MQLIGAASKETVTFGDERILGDISIEEVSVTLGNEK